MTILFHNLITKNKIVLFCFSPYFIYFTQPLDIGVFQFFKHYHIDAIDKAIWLSDKNFGKLESLDAFQSFCNKIFKPTTIRHAFKSTGLVLFNPDMIFNKICEKHAQIAQTALQTLSPSPFPLHKRTPQRAASIVKYRQKLQKAYAKLKPGEKIDFKQI